MYLYPRVSKTWGRLILSGSCWCQGLGLKLLIFSSLYICLAWVPRGFNTRLRRFGCPSSSKCACFSVVGVVRVGFEGLLEGSWDLASRIVSTVIWAADILTLLTTLLTKPSSSPMKQGGSSI